MILGNLWLCFLGFLFFTLNILWVLYPLTYALFTRSKDPYWLYGKDESFVYNLGCLEFKDSVELGISVLTESDDKIESKI